MSDGVPRSLGEVQQSLNGAACMVRRAFASLLRSGALVVADKENFPIRYKVSG